MNMISKSHEIISVIVPCFNSGKTLRRAIESIKNQTWKKKEIILVNDGSNDIHIVKDAPIPAGSSLQVLDGGAKIVMVSGDALKVKSNTASSADVWVSVVDTISE